MSHSYTIHYMNKTEYNMLKRQVEEQYIKSVQEAEKTRTKQLAALEEVWGMTRPSKKKKPVSNVNQTARIAGTTSYGSLSGSIREALKYVSDPFTKDQIKSALRQTNPDLAANCRDSSITGSLIRLVREGRIEHVFKGKGSTASQYRKIPEKEQ